ncbi:MAG: terminase gpA endonuclease subunit [Bryobacteraceae bacterium]
MVSTTHGEQLITRIVKGYRKSEWQKARERNQALDARVYARAAASTSLERTVLQHNSFAAQHRTALGKEWGLLLRRLLLSRGFEFDSATRPTRLQSQRALG